MPTSSPTTTQAPLVAIDRLKITFPSDTHREDEPVIRDLTLAINQGERIAVVGASGCGKTLTARAVLGLLPPRARWSGRITIANRALSAMSPEELRSIRGGTVGLAFQEGAASLNPVLTVGTQLIEAIRCHQHTSRAAARSRAHELLARVCLDERDAAFAAYPHQLSGGQLQRVGLALALSGDPQLVIADEPTTALDPELREDIEAVLDQETRNARRALLLLGHDLWLARRLTDRSVVMCAGDVVEDGPTDQVLTRPRHPYTNALVHAERALASGNTEGPLARGRQTQPTPPSGCRYGHECPLARESCRRERPAIQGTTGQWHVRCPFWQEQAVHDDD